MNALRAASSRVFIQQDFSPPGKEPEYYKVVSIDASSPANLQHSDVSLSTKELHDFVLSPVPVAAQSHSRFRLVCFQCTHGTILQTTRDIFDHVFSTFELPEYGRYMLCKRSSGFHQFGRRGPSMQFFLGMKSCRILYSYHVPTRSTVGILINDTPDMNNPLYDLTLRLGQSANLAPHPCFLPCLSAVSLMLFAREATRQALGGIVSLGRSVGVDIWASEVVSRDLQSAEELLRLGRMADSLGPMLGELDHIQRFFIVADQIVEAMASKGVVDALLDLKKDDIIKKTTEEVNEVMELVKGQMATEKSFIRHWQERGQNQMNMVFNMITRGDALASIQLAKAAAEDSSSMKVVATMTMVFLPATFFAALFAIPSLRWDQEAVIGDKFWVYWAFTLPSTAIVFMVWLALTKRDETAVLYRHLSDRMLRVIAGEERSTSGHKGSSA